MDQKTNTRDRGKFVLALKEARIGMLEAQYEVGLMYATGTGVANDPLEAHKWFTLAARTGDEGGQKNQRRSEARLDPAQRAEGERRAAAWLHTRGTLGVSRAAKSPPNMS